MSQVCICNRIIDNIKNSKKVKIYSILFVLFIGTLNFYKNAFGIADKDFFNNFQMDSQSLVYGKMISDRLGLNTDSPYGLMILSFKDGVKHSYDLKTLLSQDIESSNDYRSQFGLQGHIFSFIFNLALKKIDRSNTQKEIKKANKVVKNLVITCSFLTILILFFISVLFAKFINPLFGFSFFVSMFFSPWVIAFSNNLYWVSFLWFLPALFALLMYKNLDNNLKFLYGFLFSFAIFIKSLCGYEYLSAICLFAVSIFILSPFFDKKLTYKQVVKYLFIMGILAIVGFLFAISVHGYFRGEGDVLKGIESIYREDVLRRTLGGDVNNFDEVYRYSLEAGIFDVIKIYFYSFNGGLLTKYIGGSKALYNLFLIAFIFFIFNPKKYKENLALFITFGIASISWFVLGKSHSYIHTHMNYVMWYFGFVAVLVYFISQGIVSFIKKEILK